MSQSVTNARDVLLENDPADASGCDDAKDVAKQYIDAWVDAIVEYIQGDTRRPQRFLKAWRQQTRKLNDEWSECMAYPGRITRLTREADDLFDKHPGRVSFDDVESLRHQLETAVGVGASGGTASIRQAGKSDPPEADADGNRALDYFPDGSIRFRPAYTKEAADYRRPGDDDFDESHARCGSCVHFIPEEGCHFVQGEIDPGDYCAEFYAEYAAFAHWHEDGVEINAELVSPELQLDERDVTDFLDALDEHVRAATDTKRSRFGFWR